MLVLELAHVHRFAVAQLDQSDFSLRERLFEITALDAFRIVCVER